LHCCGVIVRYPARDHRCPAGAEISFLTDE
jgi:hypothetical protein